MSRVLNFYLLVIAALLTGCAMLGGTEAGNPTMTANQGNVPVPGEFAQYLLDTVCVKYHECYPSASTANCGSGILQQTNIPRGFGLSSGFGTARDMVDAEKTGTIHADYTHVVNCSSEIHQLSCASAPISAATPVGSPASATAYTGVINMIPTSGTSCAGVF